jgi:hypothetical protein
MGGFCISSLTTLSWAACIETSSCIDAEGCVLLYSIPKWTKDPEVCLLLHYLYSWRLTHTETCPVVTKVAHIDERFHLAVEVLETLSHSAIPEKVWATGQSWTSIEYIESNAKRRYSNRMKSSKIRNESNTLSVDSKRIEYTVRRFDIYRIPRSHRIRFRFDRM